MAVKLRMTRIGRRHRPFFRINAIESRSPRDGKIIEKLGHYDPIEKDPAKQIMLNTERVKYWLDKGAIPSDTVSQILLRQGIKHKYARQSSARRARAKAIARAKGKFFTKAERITAEKQTQADEEKAKAKEKAKAEAETKTETEPAEEKLKAETKVETETKAKEEAEVKPKAETEAPKKPKADTKEKTKPEAKQD